MTVIYVFVRARACVCVCVCVCVCQLMFTSVACETCCVGGVVIDVELWCESFRLGAQHTAWLTCRLTHLIRFLLRFHCVGCYIVVCVFSIKKQPNSELILKKTVKFLGQKKIDLYIRACD